MTRAATGNVHGPRSVPSGGIARGGITNQAAKADGSASPRTDESASPRTDEEVFPGTGQADAPTDDAAAHGAADAASTGAAERTDEDVSPGLAALRARFDAGPPVAVAELLGMRPVTAEHGSVTFACDAQPAFANPMGTVHGGIIATLLDSAVGCAVQTVLPTGAGYTTLSLELKYLRPVAVDVGELRATGVVVHAGRRQATAEGRLTDTAGRLLATATTTCLILSP